MKLNITRSNIAKSIKDAQQEMESAKNRLDHAETETEIDIAIYSMIAAEKKINMLYKAAKENVS